MKPSNKSPELDAVISDIFGIDRKSSIEANHCAWCKTPVKESEFIDALSLKEYQISGFCMKCQDATFTSDE